LGNGLTHAGKLVEPSLGHEVLDGYGAGFHSLGGAAIRPGLELHTFQLQKIRDLVKDFGHQPILHLWRLANRAKERS
jgi:hypothetical protein